ncbi:MAG: S8 family peptidase [Rubrobacter sp.]
MDEEYRWYIVEKAKELAPEQKYHGLSRDAEYETVATEEGLGYAAGVVPMTESEREFVRSLPHVVAVREGGYCSVPPEPNEEMATISGIEALEIHRVPDLWKMGFDGSGAKVAVLDTGLDRAHRDGVFVGRVARTRSFVQGENWEDLGSGHGTHCAGVVCAGGRDYGAAPAATLIVGKVLGDSGSGSFSGIIKGIEWAIRQGAKVISMSLGGPGGPDSAVSRAVDAAFRRGVLVACAAGNEQRGSDRHEADFSSPGSAKDGVCVGAVDTTDSIADFSNAGRTVDIAAIGVNVRSLGLGGSFDRFMSGTSMACPHVAGVAALLVGAFPNKSADEIRKALCAGARDTGLPPHREGYGILDALAAYRKLEGRAVSEKETAADGGQAVA